VTVWHFALSCRCQSKDLLSLATTGERCSAGHTIWRRHRPRLSLYPGSYVARHLLAGLIPGSGCYLA
jgi:hypothetical protein